MSGKTRFEKLLSPGRIGQLQIRNRIIRTGAIMNYANREGFITAEHKAFYRALARGGTGLIIAGGCCIDYPLGSLDSGMMRLDDDKFIPGFSELAKIAHEHGCAIFAQILHAGIMHPTGITGFQAVSSSYLPEGKLPGMPESSLITYSPPRALTVPEIEELVGKFVAAAERAQKAGFDGVEVNGAASHLINSFLSRAWNKRQDEYGYQSMESRARFFVEVIQAIKKRLGQDFPVSTILNCSEFGIEQGITIDEAQKFAQIIQDAGANAIEARGTGFSDYSGMLWPESIFYPEPPKHLISGLDWNQRGAGATVPMAAAIKKVVSIPIITVGRLDPILGEKVLREGKADFIGLQRRLIVDPELPNKVSAGRLEDITPCMACLHCLQIGAPVRCRINAALGGNEDYTIKPAEKQKKVVVVGGGPAGMEAARVAAMRGHKVILFEKETKLGGLLPMAALVKGTEIEDLMALIRYFKTQITKLGVDIRLGKEFNPSQIEELKPDAVILASGGLPAIPEIPGINRRNVVSGGALHHKLKIYLRIFGPKLSRRLTRFWMPIDKRVVIIGGDIQGCELAEFLAKRGRKVTIVDTGDMLGKNLPGMKRGPLLQWLANKGVIMISGVKYEEITDKGLAITTKEGQRQTIEADTVVTAVPLMPNTGLFKALKGKVPEVYLIGDCSEPRLIINAITEGYYTARTI